MRPAQWGQRQEDHAERYDTDKAFQLQSQRNSAPISPKKMLVNARKGKVLARGLATEAYFITPLIASLAFHPSLPLRTGSACTLILSDRQPVS